jgi:hypothetical protein
MNTTNFKNRMNLSVIAGALIFLFTISVNAAEGKKIVKEAVKTESNEELTIENWMYNLAEWNTGEDKIVEKTIEENKLETIAASEFNTITKEKLAEDEIVLEEWMLDAGNDFWNGNTIEQDSVDTEEIEIEDWMVDLSKW